MNIDGEPPLTLERREDAPAPRRLNRKALLVGVAAAAALGLGFGLMAKPQLITERLKPAPMQPAAEDAAQAGERRMDIEMAELPPAQPLPPRPPLETMSPELAQAAAQPPVPPEPIPAPLPPPAPRAPEAPWAPDAPPAPEPVRAERPSFDCRQARSLAEEMVCANPALAAADRHMARAYQRAARAGAPYDELRADQDAWLAYREEAALRSPRAVATAYDRRIAELEAIADGRR